MKITIDFDRINETQREAFIRCQKIYNCDFFKVSNSKELEELFEEAKTLWWNNFPFEASLLGDDWWVERRYNDLNKMLNNLERR